MKYKNKKADSTGMKFVIALIITVAFALIYLLWLKDFRIFGENLEDYTICKNSNIENAKLRLKINNQVIQERKGNKCKTEYITVPKDKELEFVAKKMSLCWDIYLEGKEELFETEDNNYCAFCSVLTFKDKKQLNGLTNYLIEHQAPTQGKSYYQYLTRTVVTDEIFQEIENSQLNDLHTIDTSKPLAVMFVMGKNVYPDGIIKASSVTTGGIGAIAGGAIGSTAIAGVLIKSGIGLCIGIPVVGCTIGAILVGVGGVTGALALGVPGYFIGSHNNPDLDTKILLWPYTKEDLSQLKCTMLEGKDRLDIKKF